MTVSSLDLPIVARQLGRSSVDQLHPISRVVARCPWRLPAVVECWPYDQRGRPFPTLFYATCPTLVAAVGLLETEGGVASLGRRAAAEPELSSSLRAAVRYERRRRRQLARGPAALAFARAADDGGALDTGIGGVPAASPSLKCMHAHAAHALAVPGYALGRLILAQAERAAGSLWCGDARCQHLEAPDKPAASDSPVRVAAVDLGTNTCRLLLARAGRSPCSPLHPDHRETRVVRLGQGVDRTGRLHPDAIARARACLADYAPLIDQYRPDARGLFATSVLRDAADGEEFLDAVRRDFGLPWRVLSGDDEGTLAFRGASCAVDSLRGTLLVLDIGGGSTEFAVGPAQGLPLPGSGGQATGCVFTPPVFVRSVDVGAVRLTERFLHHDPPKSGEWAAAVRFVRRLLREQIPVDLCESVDVGIGLAGTIATLSALTLRLTDLRRELIDGHPLTLAEMDSAITELRRITSSERLRLPGIQRGREDVILAGALIAREAARLFRLPGFRYSGHDVLDGQALELSAPHLGG